jgi:SAM-dependent methyltransferase
VTCPVCRSATFEAVVSTDEIEAEIRRREHFVLAGLGRKPSPAEAKDLTDFMHGFAAPLKACSGCGLFVRAERHVRDADSYSADPNDPDVMRQLLPRYVQAFANKSSGYRDLLHPHADVLEIGSHLGAFLEIAENWNWTALGLDVGEDTSDFVRNHGLKVRRETVEDTRLPARSFDAVFIWNCFEQLPQPADSLKAVYALLRPFGLLVIRVPNARFYEIMRSRNQAALAWNNLLGFPYLFGYREFHIHRLAYEYGFEFVRGFDSELITMPFADLRRDTHDRQIANSRNVADWSIKTTANSGLLTGPWIEVVYRKIGQNAQTSRTGALDLNFLSRAA